MGADNANPAAGPDLAADAREALLAGDLPLALERLQARVRANAADAKLRTFLFQLLAVMGQWERALKQLAVVGEMDASTLPMVQTYREAIACEALRAEVFAGRRVPLLLGEPQAWSAMMIEALLTEGRGEAAEGAALRGRALDQAPAQGGTANGRRFDWMTDADSRIGPMLEAVLQGRYYWIPFSRLAAIRIEPPEDLRDMVWTAAELEFSNGGGSVALIPTRYAGTPFSDSQMALARRTDWVEDPPGRFAGQGQRVFATPDAEFAILELREVTFDAVPDDDDGEAGGGSA